MFEAFLLFVLVVGLARRRGERWEWSRERAARALSGWMDQAGILVRRVRRALPDLWSCCRRDVRSLIEDIVAVAHPRLYHRMATPKPGLAAPAGVTPPAGDLGAPGSERGPGARERLASVLRGVAAGGAPSEAPTTPAWRRLQRRYLDGRITLEQYVAEAERLRGGAV
jgi:hypothetical protein